MEPSLTLLPARGRRSFRSVPSALGFSLSQLMPPVFTHTSALPVHCEQSTAGTPRPYTLCLARMFGEWMPSGSKSGDRNQIGTGNTSLGTTCSRWSSLERPFRASVPAAPHSSSAAGEAWLKVHGGSALESWCRSFIVPLLCAFLI